MTTLERLYDVQFDSEPVVAPVPAPAMTIFESSDDYGRFVIEPLPRGKGMTLGNSLRRTLLSSIDGSAVTWARIAGVQHEYSSLAGMREDVNEFLLNLKGIRVRAVAARPGRLRLEIDGEGEVRAGDVLSTSDFEIVNPEHHLATLDSQEARLSVEMNVEQGVGYRAAAVDEPLTIGVLPVDAVFSPIRKASFSVENLRIGGSDEMERLAVEVWTDRTMSPLDAIQAAAKELARDLYLVSSASEGPLEQDTPFPHLPPEKLNMRVEELGLSARTKNALRRSGLNRVIDVLSYSDEDLMEIRNFGKTSRDELMSKLAEHGLLAGEDDATDSKIGD